VLREMEFLLNKFEINLLMDSSPSPLWRLVTWI